MLIYRGLFTIVIIIVAILSSTPLMTNLPDKKNILKPKATPKKPTGNQSTSSKIGQQVTTSITVNKKKVIIERKEKGKAPLISTFIMNSEGQLIEDDNTEGQDFTSFFGIEAQDVPVQQSEVEMVKARHDNMSLTPFVPMDNTVFQNYSMLREKYVQLFSQIVVMDKMESISGITSEKRGKGTPDRNIFSRDSYMKQDRFL